MEIRFKRLKKDQWIAYIGFMTNTFMPIHCEIGDIKIIYNSIKVKLDVLLQRYLTIVFEDRRSSKKG